MAWTEPVEISYPATKATPVLVAFPRDHTDALHLFCRGRSSEIWHSWTDNGLNWSDPVMVPVRDGIGSPAIAVFPVDGRSALHLVQLGKVPRRLLHTWSFDGVGWSQEIEISGRESLSEPALVAGLDRLQVVFQEKSTLGLWHGWFRDGDRWIETPIPLQSEECSISLADRGLYVMMIYRELSSDALHIAYFSGLFPFWTSSVLLTASVVATPALHADGSAVVLQSAYRPALATMDGVTHMIHSLPSSGIGNQLLWTTCGAELDWTLRDEKWVVRETVARTVTKTGPALAAFDNELHLVFMDANSSNIWHMRADGQAFNFP